MNQRAVTMEVRLRERAEIIRECRSSGMSVTEWCHERGISKGTYYRWQRQVREAACWGLSVAPESEKGLILNGWTRLEPSQPSVTESRITIEINGCCVTATAETDPVLLTKVCRMLKSL